MRSRRVAAFVLPVLAQCVSCSLQAQVTIRGRVEDALTLTPIEGARVVAPDTTAVYTDSLGIFSLDLDDDGPLFVEVTQYGYVVQRFDLPPEAVSRTSVLRLEPIAIELEALEITTESSVTSLLNSLQSRRNGYAGGLQVFDRARLEDMAGAGSVWDFVQSRLSSLHECDPFNDYRGPDVIPLAGSVGLDIWSNRRSGVCVSGRASLNNPRPEVGVLVCIDAWESWSAISELESMDIRSVALVEIYGRGVGGIRVYTSRYLLSMASRGRTISTPLHFGC